MVKSEIRYNCELYMFGMCKKCDRTSDFKVTFITDERENIIRTELTCEKCDSVQAYIQAE